MKKIEIPFSEDELELQIRVLDKYLKTGWPQILKETRRVRALKSRLEKSWKKISGKKEVPCFPEVIMK